MDIRVKVAGINPIDNFVVSGALPKLIPLPNHIPGAEISGIIEEVGSHVNNNNLRKGDRVIIHNKVFDGTCDMCLNGLDMICRNGGLISVITNGGFPCLKEMCSRYQTTWIGIWLQAYL